MKMCEGWGKKRKGGRADWEERVSASAGGARGNDGHANSAELSLVTASRNDCGIRFADYWKLG